MPDRDNIPRGVPSKFSRAYKQLSEWQFREDEIAREASMALLKQAQEYGDAPLKAINMVSQELKKCLATPLFEIDWDKLYQDVDKFLRNTISDNRIRGHVRDVINSHINSIRLNQLSENEDHNFQIVKGYLFKLYDAFFEDRVMTAPQHLEGETQENIEERLMRIRPYIEEHISEFTEKIIKTYTIKNIQPPIDPKKDVPIGLNDNILDP